MNVTTSLEIELRDEEIEALRNGEALSVPIDSEQRVVLYPPPAESDQ